MCYCQGGEDIWATQVYKEGIKEDKWKRREGRKKGKEERRVEELVIVFEGSKGDLMLYKV